MFNKSSNNTNKPEISRVDTIIGENAVVEGVLRTKDTTRIDGKIKGEGFFEGLLEKVVKLRGILLLIQCWLQER